MSGQGASPSRTRHVGAPLQKLRLAANLTVQDLARRFGTSTANVSRWCSGEREAPAAFVMALRRAALGKAADVAAAQAQYIEEQRRRRRGPAITLDVCLPPDVDPDDARELAEKAVTAALAEARQRAAG